jgi:hypothetical protein
MDIASRSILAFLICAIVPLTVRAQVEVREIPTRSGVTLKFVYAKAEQPVATAVLFQGGEGIIGIYPNGSMANDKGFLSGGAGRFTRNNISVVIPDVPSDRRSLNRFRDTAEHATDNAALIEFLRQQSKVPVWAIGTSNGSLSAAATAVHLKEKGPDGIVLTSTVSREGPRSGASHPVTMVPLNQVLVPTLLVHHKDDGCYVSPYSAMPDLVAAFKAAPKVELITVEGGSGGNPCVTGHHQFLGIEGKVTDQISEWIKAQSGTMPKAK